MPDRLRFQLVTPERKVLDVECDEVQLPGTEGYFGVLPGHTPLIALLKIGEGSCRIGKKETYAAIGAGFAEVSGDVVTVLTDFADLPSEIDVDAAERAQAEAQEEMKTVGPESFDVIHAKLETAVTRVQVAARR
jgi:F-type H+-transporting ATPase subunit epsilon